MHAFLKNRLNTWVSWKSPQILELLVKWASSLDILHWNNWDYRVIWDLASILTRVIKTAIFKNSMLLCYEVVFTRAQYNISLDIRKIFGEIPKEVNYLGMKDFLTQNYGAGIGSLFLEWIIITIPWVTSLQIGSSEIFIELNWSLFPIPCWTCRFFYFMSSSNIGAVLSNLISIFLRMKETREIALWPRFMKELALFLTHKEYIHLLL